MIPKTFPLVQCVVKMLEEQFGCIIEVDGAALREAEIQAEKTIGHVTIPQPNALKQASHHAFWMRKLKPLRVVNLSAFQELANQLIDKNLVKGNVDTIQSMPPLPSSFFVNEMCAILSAIAIAGVGGYKITITKESLHDFATTLRYHSFSPSAINATLWAYVQKTP